MNPTVKGHRKEKEGEAETAIIHRRKRKKRKREKKRKEGGGTNLGKHTERRSIIRIRVSSHSHLFRI